MSRSGGNMNTDIFYSRFQVSILCRYPPFTKVLGNFDFIDFSRFSIFTGVSVAFSKASTDNGAVISAAIKESKVEQKVSDPAML